MWNELNSKVSAIKVLKWLFAVSTIVCAIIGFIFPARSFILGLVSLSLSLHLFCMCIDARMNPNPKQSYSPILMLMIVGIINFIVSIIILST